MEKLSKNNPIYNLNMAFKTAEEKLGICKLLDPEDVYTENGIPDGKFPTRISISKYFKTFSNSRKIDHHIRRHILSLLQ